MNFEFADELLQLRDQARRFFDQCPPAMPRRILDTDESCSVAFEGLPRDIPTGARK